MKGIDTNILVRFLVGDDKKQAQQVYQLFKKVESTRNELFVPLLVMLELIWVLESVYEISRSEILDSISELLLMPVLKFDQLSTLQSLVYIAKGNKQDLSDLLIACSAKDQDCKSVLTFDQRASKSGLFEL